MKKIEVTLADRQEYVGTRVAHDPKTDLAIIKINVPRKLPVINIGISSDPKANLMQAEVEVRTGDFKRAKERAGIAQQNLKPGTPAWLRADDIFNIAPPKQEQ